MQKGGALTDLGMLPGCGGSVATGINAFDHVVGYSTTSSGFDRATLWNGGSIADLGTLPGDVRSYARAINNKDQIAGTSDGPDGAHHAFLIANGAMYSLGTLGGLESAALGINDDGVVVGWSTASDGVQYPFRWSAATGMVALGTTSGSAYAVNVHGQVVGDTDGRAALWDLAGVRTDLGAAFGGDYSWAYGINDAGQVVGQNGTYIPPDPNGPTTDPGYWDYEALVWDRSNGARMPTLVGGSAVYEGLYSAYAINNNSQIIAQSNYGQYYVLSPSDCPAAPWLESATALGDNRIQLSWTQGYAATFNVKRSTYPGGYTTIATGVTTTTLTDSGLTAGTTYYYVVSGVSATGSEGYNSNEVQATAVVVLPSTNLRAVGGGRKIDLTWTQSSSSGVTKNRIYRWSAQSSSYALLATIHAGTTYTDTSVRRNTAYWYVVTAMRSDGSESPYSNEAYATSK